MTIKMTNEAGVSITVEEIKLTQGHTLESMKIENSDTEGPIYRTEIKKDGYTVSRTLITRDEDEHKVNMCSHVIALIEQKIEGSEEEIEEQVRVRGVDYDVMMAISIKDNKVVYDLSTTNNLIDENIDCNMVVRKTWNGMENYIKRFI